VSAVEIAANGFNLDRKKPSAKDDFEHLPPEPLADDILQKELRVAETMREIKEIQTQISAIRHAMLPAILDRAIRGEM
jgi:hypothetical protein